MPAKLKIASEEKSLRALRKEAATYSAKATPQPVPIDLKISISESTGGPTPTTWQEVVAAIEAQSKARTKVMKNLERIRKLLKELEGKISGDYLGFEDQSQRYKEDAEIMLRMLEVVKTLDDEQKEEITRKNWKFKEYLLEEDKRLNWYRMFSELLNDSNFSDELNGISRAARHTRTVTEFFRSEIKEFRKEMERYFEIDSLIDESLNLLSDKSVLDDVRNQWAMLRSSLEDCVARVDETRNILDQTVRLSKDLE